MEPALSLNFSSIVALQDASDFKKQDSKSVAALSIIAAFVRCGKEDFMGRVPDLHGSLAAPVQDIDALLQSGTSDISNEALKLQGILKRLDTFYSNRYMLCDCIVVCTCCR